MTTIIDLSLPLDAAYRHMTPEDVPDLQLNLELLKDYRGGAGQRVSAVQMRLHHGTHVDAPMHFKQGGASISDLPLDTFYGRITLLDLTQVGKDRPIHVSDLEDALAGRAVKNQRIFLRTDWNENFGNANYESDSPYISPQAVDWLVERGPRLVSYDYSHGKDAPDADAKYYAVRTFLSNDIVTMGYVRNLDMVDASRPAVLAAFPLYFCDVEASPVRAVVIQ